MTRPLRSDTVPPGRRGEFRLLICMHAGAHKTASTYVQSRLMEERDRLADAGVGVVAHGFFRRQVSDRLDAAEGFGGVGHALARKSLKRPLAKMVEFHAGRERVIMSDENLAGPMLGAIGPDGLYPQARRRIGAAFDALPASSDRTLFFAIRNYAAYFSSIYVYRREKREARETETFRRSALDLQRGWTDVVSDLCAAAGADRVVVWTYDEFAKRPSLINAALLGEDAPRIFAKTDRASLPSLSRKGLAVLDRVSDMLSENEHAGLARAIARFQFDKPDEKFSLFAPEELAALDARFNADLDAISALGCRLIKAEPRSADAQETPAEDDLDPETERPAA